MRIQEMKSGMTHLRKKVADAEQDNFFEQPEARDVSFEEETTATPTVDCDLEEPCWSVISFDRIEAGGMTYEQAVRLVVALNAAGVPGLCLITDAAAQRTAG